MFCFHNLPDQSDDLLQQEAVSAPLHTSTPFCAHPNSDVTATYAHFQGTEKFIFYRLIREILLMYI